MRLHQFPSLFLAVLLQIVPICRTVLVNAESVQTGFAILFRWVAGAGVLLGGIDAVSGASAAISGLKPYVGTTQVGPTSLTPTIPDGATNITLRIIVANPGINPELAYYNCSPLPAGLTINTNLGANGYITNVPGQTIVAGVYPVTLLAGNVNFGFITTNATITVQASSNTLPTITTQPQSLTVTNGNPASFTVVASGSPAPTYQWRKNGATLNGATLATYRISAATTNDAGSYDVVASNSSGSVTSSPPATLTVLVPPSILTQPHDLTVTKGDTAIFMVEASGFPAPTYQWRKDGANISSAKGASHTITGVTTNDAGGYDVVVANAAGSITSSPPAMLTVRPLSLLPLALTNMTMTGGVPAFDITGPANTNYVIWSSTDLLSWSAVRTNFTADGTLHFSDSGSPPANARFYRGAMAP